MTVSSQIAPQVGISRRRQRLRAAELRENDLSPVCPHCYELAAAASVVCAECGKNLTQRRSTPVEAGAWSASA